jgi:LDH2 family malate/lactate/ureidoglycolate dehydrogenase
VGEILLPGELEERLKRERLVTGIPLATATVDTVSRLCRERDFEL